MTSSVISPKVLEIITRLEAAGAEDCLLVGGWVRDQLMGTVSKDYDIEVYGLNYEQIVRALQDFRVNVVGKSFGVVKVDHDIDVSVPRRENKMGIGHKGFSIESDPSMNFREAASRRDFTINAIGMRKDGSLLDPFDGIRDIEKKHLRATSPAFKEDPLRVLRGMQFAARLGFSMDAETVAMCREIHDEFASLSPERIYEEWLKWSRGAYPTMGLQVLEQTHWLSHFPELASLQQCEQDPEWHPEGDVWVHTGHVCDAAAQIADRKGLSGKQRTILLFSALLHDIGKPSTTYLSGEQRWISPGHAAAGKPLTETFFKRMRAPQWLVAVIVPLVVEHMVHLSIPFEQKPAKRIVRRLANRLHPATIQQWAALCEADHSGRPPKPKENPVKLWETVAIELALEDRKPKPLLQGKDLIKMGLQPGPAMGQLLRQAFEAQLDGKFDNHRNAIAWVEELLMDNSFD